MFRVSRFLSVVVLAIVITTGGLQAAAEAADIGLAWVGQSGMANRVTAGFEKGMKEFAPDVKIEYRKELGAMDELAALVSKWEKEKQGMVLLRSNAAEWLGSNAPAIPTFIGGCNHPVILGAVKDLESPGGNITGVTYYLPHATQFEIFSAILPNLKSVMLLVDKNNPSADVDRQGTKSVCAKQGIEYKETLCETFDDALKSVQQNTDNVSAFVIGNQALIMDSADQIVAAAGKTPVVSYSNKAVKLGALGGFVADDQKLGYMLAQSVADVLLKGKAPGSIAIKVDPDPQFFVNVKTAQKLGLEIPFSILSSATVIE